VNYCSECGAPVRRGIPEGDDHPRDICDACGTVHYRNPKIIAGCLPVWGDQLLLCRRAIDPRKGYWTLPAGFMEEGETLAYAARREALEEANVVVEIADLYAVFSLPHLSQVYVFYRANMLDERFHPGAESLETRLFQEHEIPWEDLSFETVYRSLRHYFADRKSGLFRLHHEDIGPFSQRLLNIRREPSAA
jgi:ADP-ribose pyrophosphatase YjhB (NUDIX family)